MEEIGADTTIEVAISNISSLHSISEYADVHKEVAKAALIGSSGANHVIQVFSERHTFTRRGRNMNAVSVPIAVVAEVYPSGCAFVECDVCCWCSESGGCSESNEGRGELHVGILERF